MELHDGSVAAHSDGPRKGSEFSVRLPLLVGTTSNAASENSREDTVVVEKHRVLVVDDNVDSAATLGMLLKKMGHEVHIAHDGTSALEVAPTFQPALILLDLGLPGMNG